MAIRKEQIARKTKGQLEEMEDWWYLCYNDIDKIFFIEHTWDYANAYNLKPQNNSGSEIFPFENWTGPGAENIQNCIEKLSK